MNELAAALLQALSAAVVAVVLTVAVVLLSRRPPAPGPLGPGSAVTEKGADVQKSGASADEAASRLRFPARALERLLVVGVVAVAVAVVGALLSVYGVDRDVWLGGVAVTVGLGWMLWRGTFLSLQAGSRRG